MWQCRKCSKPVYFAERKQSLGFDWHPNCLRCEECGKRLNPGQHAEHKGVPFCHHPCYGALFGPQLFGHGTRNECHTSFGKIENRDGQIKRSHLESRLKMYNSLYEGKPGELKSREANGRLVLEGVLRIYWGVKHIIHLKEEDDSRMIATRRQISMPSRLNIPLDSESDEDIGSTLWRDESPNRIGEIDKPNHNVVVEGNIPETAKSLDCAIDISDRSIPISETSSIFDCAELHIAGIDQAGLIQKNNEEHLPSMTSANDHLLSDSDSVASRINSLSSGNCSINTLKEPGSSSEFDTANSLGCQTADLCDNSEYLTPLIDSLDDNTQLNDANESHMNYNDTLTSSFSDQFGTLTFSSNLDSHEFNDEKYVESKPLLSSSSVEYSSALELDLQTPTSDSSPYSDGSDPLTSFSDTSEPQTPMSDDSVSQIPLLSGYSLNETSSLKLIKNSTNNFRRQTSFDNVANTIPFQSTQSQINADIIKSRMGSQSSKLSYHSVDSHLNSPLLESPARTPLKNGSTAIRRRPGRRMDKSRLKRRCSINGHYYLRETSSFTPPYGSPCSIWITSKTTAEEVLNMLLEKYKVEMSTYNFALFVVKDSGELRRIREDESPLVTRVMLGPHEDVAKVFIMDAQRTQEVSHEVAQFLNLSLAECRAILAKYEQEEVMQIKSIRKKYDEMRFFIQKRIVELRSL